MADTRVGKRGKTRCVPVATPLSIDLLVCPDRLQQNRFLAFPRHETEDDAKIIARATGPRTFQASLQLVGLQLGMKSVGRKKR